MKKMLTCFLLALDCSEVLKRARCSPHNVCTIQNASKNASRTPCLVACLLLLNSMVRKEKHLNLAASTPYKR